MKKFLSCVLIVVMIITLGIPVGAKDDYNCVAYGNYEYDAGVDVFNSRIYIDGLQDVEQLILTVKFNKDVLANPDCDYPGYFSVETVKGDGELVFTITGGSGFYEKENFFITFDVINTEVREEEEIGFEVSGVCRYTSGDEINLDISTSVDIYIHLPVVVTNSHASIKVSPNHYIFGQDVHFTCRFSNRGLSGVVEYIRLDVRCNTDVLVFKGFGADITDSSIEFDVQKTETGYSIYYSDSEAETGAEYSENYDLIFNVASKSEPNLQFDSFVKLKNKDEQIFSLDINTPANMVYDAESIPSIILNDRYALCEKDGVIYVPHEVTGKRLLENVSSSHVSSDFRISGLYANDEQDLVETGSDLNLYFDGEICDSKKICIIGDINGTGDISAADARLALRHGASLENLEGLAFSAADSNGDGNVNAADARKILRVASKLDSHFNVHTVEMKKGETVVFDGLESVGMYTWECTIFGEDDLAAEREFANYNPPMNVGGPLDTIFTFTANETGEYKVVFEYTCPWTEDVIDSFEFNVIVR